MVYRLSEGDGSILSSKSGHLSFVITQNEPNVLYHIQDKLGFGVVRYDKIAKCYRFIVRDLLLSKSYCTSLMEIFFSS